MKKEKYKMADWKDIEGYEGLMEIYGVAYSTMQQLVTNVTWKNI